MQGDEINDDDYVKFVIDSVNEYRKYSDKLTHSDKELQPYEIQYTLAHYHSAKLGLLAEMCRQKRVYKLLEREFKLWWNDCLLTSKKSLTGEKKKFVAVKDYTIQAEADNKDLYAQKTQAVADAEERYEFLKLLKADWDSFQFTLQVLNDNMKSEMRSLRLSDEDMYTNNEVPKQVRRTVVSK